MQPRLSRAGPLGRLPVVAAVDENLLLAALDQKRVALFAAMPRAVKALSDANLSDRCAIVIGAEGRGVSPKLQERATGL